MQHHVSLCVLLNPCYLFHNLHTFFTFSVATAHHCHKECSYTPNYHPHYLIVMLRLSHKHTSGTNSAMLDMQTDLSCFQYIRAWHASWPIKLLQCIKAWLTERCTSGHCHKPLQAFLGNRSICKTHLHFTVLHTGCKKWLTHIKNSQPAVGSKAQGNWHRQTLFSDICQRHYKLIFLQCHLTLTYWHYNPHKEATNGWQLYTTSQAARTGHKHEQTRNCFQYSMPAYPI